SDANFPRSAAALREGLHAAFGFPLRSPRGVVGVMEFFSHEAREPDERLLESMSVLGSQVGQFVARRQAEADVRSRESRLRATLEAALDAVVTMDQRGRVLDWNHAAETTFGYRADEQLRASRARLVEVAEAERRRIQRNLHDGAQQRLVSVLLTMGRLRRTADEGQNALLDVAIDELTAGLEELRELAGGLHPSVLAERGLAAALEALVLRTPLAAELVAVP